MEFPMVVFYQLFWIPNLFVIPLLTMRSISEERRMGTLETLMTTPITSFQIVLSKFVSAFCTYLIFWLITLFFSPITSWVAGSSTTMGDLANSASLLGSMLFIAISGACFVSIGIFSSSLTRSQLVAGMLSFTGIFLVLVSGRLFAEIPLTVEQSLFDLGAVLHYFQSFEHFDMFANGIIDLRPFIYYLSATILLLAISTQVVEQKT